MTFVPFNKPFMTGRELAYIAQAHHNRHLAGGGEFTKLCQYWLESNTGSAKALLTHSCTAALEMAAILLNIQAGDEIILPSFTFVSSANAFVLRGARLVFVDIREDTLNINEELIEEAITPRTKIIVPVHYAGVACEMDRIMEIADRHNLFVVEDAAQGIMSKYKGRALGSIGHLGALSFHETKNIISGEGGALLINDPSLAERAEIVLEKGTNRKQFFRGQVDKYTWVDLGSSYLPSELVAAFLWAQMEEAEKITDRRLSLWEEYHQSFEEMERQGVFRRPFQPADCEHNAHMYYLLAGNGHQRDATIDSLRQLGVQSVFHYVPLHSSPAGLQFGAISNQLEVTESVSRQLLRLPMWIGLESVQNKVIEAVEQVFSQRTPESIDSGVRG